MMKISIERFFPDLTQLTFNGLMQYYETIEAQIYNIEKSEREKIQLKINEMGLEPDEAWIEWDLARQEHEPIYKMMYPNFHRYSFVVLLYLIIEGRFREFCSIVGERKKVLPPEPRENIIKEYKVYLSKLGVITQEQPWEDIHDLSKIRNCIVHRSGYVKDSKYEKRLRVLAKKGIGLEISSYETRSEAIPLYYENDTLIIQPEYCLNAISAAETLFQELCNALPLRGVTLL